MKKLPILILMSMSALCMAQANAQSSPRPTAAKEDQQQAKSAAEEAKARQELAEARQRLDQAAREVAELSGKLGEHARRDIRIIEGGPRRAVLGIQVDANSGNDGARVLSVSPGGPAAEAGLLDKDIIIAVDGVPLPGGDPDRALIAKMRTVKPDQKVKVVVLRNGKKQDYVVVARAQMHAERRMNVHVPEMGHTGVAGGPVIHQFRGFFPGEFEGLELATITPKLGAYFGVNEGVLVVQAPKDGAFKLEDGDVLQSIDGRKPDNGPHALRILRSYGSGEKLNLNVLRQRKPVTVAVTMPDRPEGGFMFDGADIAIPAMPVMPPMPAMPAAPPMPGGPGPNNPGSTME
jgi:membrane-associated protease RseP (regulator of RpoE activity)